VGSSLLVPHERLVLKRRDTPVEDFTTSEPTDYVAADRSAPRCLHSSRRCPHSAVVVQATTVTGEAQLAAALEAWNLRPEQFLHPWQTDDPK
jgi:hypothetical protein